MNKNIEGNNQSANIDDGDIFIKIKEQILFILLLRGYKKQILSNTIYLIVAFVMLTFISNLIIPKEAIIIFLIVIRLIQVGVVYILKDYVKKERTEADIARMKKLPLYLVIGVISSFYFAYSLIIMKTSGPYGPLSWYRESYGPATFSEATNYCQNLGNGWRIPTQDEFDYAVKGRFFPNWNNFPMYVHCVKNR